MNQKQREQNQKIREMMRASADSLAVQKERLHMRVLKEQRGSLSGKKHSVGDAQSLRVIGGYMGQRDTTPGPSMKLAR